ncbi:MAG: hypothetical protein HDS72_04380 [Bacteroidales bacterium]|nr:hypothetical protein [Bacteroidales bacterium]
MFSIESLKRSVGYICAFAGITCYVIAYAACAEGSLAYKILLNIADVLIIGVVVGYLSNVAQWAGVFKKEIQDIVFGKKLVGERKDIEEVWSNVTKQILKNKFADIHKDLLLAMKKNLPADDAISYYDDYDSDIVIDWVNKEQGIIKTVETMSFFLISETDKEITLPLKTFTIGNPSECIVTQPEITVDGKIPTIHHEKQRKDDSGELVDVSFVRLKGKNRYQVRYVREKKYDVNKDYFIGLKSQYLIHDLCVSLTLPDGLDATFIERGTNISFIKVKKEKSYIKMKLKGVIFPQQGYIFALNAE